VNLEPLLAQLKDRTAQRKLHMLLRRGIEDLEHGAGGFTAASNIAQECVRIVAPATTNEILDTGELLSEAYKRAELMFRREVRSTLPLGMSGLQEYLSIQPGSLNILAAETGVGKTSLAITWAWAMGIEGKIPVLYLNSEMGADELGLRMFSIGANIPYNDLRTGRSEQSLSAARAAREYFAGGKVYASRALGNLTSSQVVSLSRLYKMRGNVEVIFVDYIQRLKDARKDRQEWQTLIEITQTLKSLATDLNAIVFAVAQLNYMGELAGAKGMANECDLVLSLSRADKPQFDGQTHWLKVEKGRFIPTGQSFPLMMDGMTLAFDECAV
jgi:replicative DNA helicase